MEKLHKFWFWNVLIAQTALVVATFWRLIIDGQRYLFMDSYDGMRNYFAYHNFINQGKTNDFFLFNNMNYPFGDYILYTDNTPLLAVIVKWFSENIYDISNFSLSIFHWFYVFSIVLSSAFLYLIGKRFIKTKWLLALFSIAVPWITPQLLRFNIGHFSLALSCCILAVLYGLVRLYFNYKSDKKVIWSIVGIITAVVLSSFLHMYFLVINGFLIGYFCLIWAMLNWKSRIDFAKIIGFALLIPLTALGVVLTIVRNIDTYYHLRHETAEGFGYSVWQMTLDALYVPHNFSTVPSFLSSSMEFQSYEGVGYIGAFALYGLATYILFLIINLIRTRLLNLESLINVASKTDKNRHLIFIISITGILCLWISFGVKALFFNGTLRFDNWLNPFYFLVKLFDQVTQFRAMGRFSWIFFFTINIFILYKIDKYWHFYNKKWLPKILLFVLCAMLSIDAIDSMVNQNKRARGLNPLTEVKYLKTAETLIADIDIDKYQAILPLPYYHSSCEDYHYTINPNDKWATQTYQFTTLTGLPLMASQTARSPVQPTYELFELFLKDGIPKAISERLTDQSILVILNNEEYAWDNPPTLEPGITVFENGRDFPQKKNMKKLKDFHHWTVYEWNP